MIPRELLFPDHLFDGTLKNTMLGDEYQLLFHIKENNQVKRTCVFMSPTSLSESMQWQL